MRAVALLALLSLTSCAKPKSFIEQRAASPTKLTNHTPSPQAGDDLPPDDATEVFYESDGRRLRAWLFRPENSEGKQLPAVVFFHGGFAMGIGDVDDARPFLEAGYALLLPMLRGENGNAGDFEYLRGEFDDARAAVNWLAKQDGIDATHISVFGHSAGGVIAAMFSLCAEPKLHRIGSAAALYDERLFERLRVPLPFDINDVTEKRLRVFSPNADLMLHKHVAFVGTQDPLVALGTKVAQKRAPNGMLEVVEVNGDHHGMLGPAVREFVKRLK